MTRLRTDRPARFGVLLALPLLAALALGGLATATPEPTQQAGMQELSLRVDGLSCPFCAYGLEKKLEKVDNVASLEIQMETGRAVIHPEPGTSVDLAAVAEAVRKGGFTPRTVTVKARGRLDELDDRPVLSLPGDTLLVLADDEITRNLLAEAGGLDPDGLVEVEGVVEFDHLPEGHAGHPFTLKVEAYEVKATA